MSVTHFRPLPPQEPQWHLFRCFGISRAGSVPHVGCNGCNHVEQWEPEHGLTGENGSHAALRRMLDHVAQCPKVLPYPWPTTLPLGDEGPSMLLPVAGKSDTWIAVYAPPEDVGPG